MRNITAFLSLILLAAPALAAPGKPLPAFPGARGFGAASFGGSGRHLPKADTKVFRVSSLADDGEHSLRECVTATGPRVCVFETSGLIPLKTKIEVTEPYLTIAGQTAPAPGISLTGAALKISTHDVIVRHIATRVGDSKSGPKPNERDGVTIAGKAAPTFNVILDHLSMTWALDENFSTYGEHVHNITLSNSIVAEGLYHSIHPDGPHSMGILIGDGSRKISITGCLLAHNNDRNPRQKAGSELEFTDNVVYNWGGVTGGHMANLSDPNKTNRPTLLNFIGNYYKPGPNSPKAPAVSARPPSSTTKVYVSQNIGASGELEKGEEWSISSLPTSMRSMTPVFPLSGTPRADPAENFEQVLNSAGSRPIARDIVDARIVDEVRGGTGSIRDCVSGCPQDTGGLPRIVVNTRKLTLPLAPNADKNGNGYTDLEDYLNCLADELSGKSNPCIH